MQADPRLGLVRRLGKSGKSLLLVFALAMRGRGAHNRAAQTRTSMPPTTNVGLPAFGSGSAFRFARTLVAFVLWLAMVGFAPVSRAVTFTSNVTISEGDTTYDGQDIIVDGATATINGAHSFNSLSLIRRLTRTDSPPPHRSA
jgi:hypothetical protein